MSRIGKKPVDVPSGAKVELAGGEVKVSGPKAKSPLTWRVPAGIEVQLESDGRQVVVTRANDQKQTRAYHGLTRSLIANMVHGVTEGYEKRLEIYGTGYGCQVQGQNLHLNLGYMGRGTKDKPQFVMPIPQGVEVAIETPAARGNSDPARMTVRGADKQAVGEFAAEVRALRPPEPYLGKGVRYAGERIIRKAGKAFASGG